MLPEKFPLALNAWQAQPKAAPSTAVPNVPLLTTPIPSQPSPALMSPGHLDNASATWQPWWKVRPRPERRLRSLLVALAFLAAPSAATSATASFPQAALDRGTSLIRSRTVDLSQASGVCMVTPWAEHQGPDGAPEALVPLTRPTLLAVGAFQAVQLEAAGQVLWSRQARPGQPLEGPIPWPLPPLQPGQRVWWRLQPLDANPEDFASLKLRAAPAATLQRQEQLLRWLGQDPARWLAAVQQALEQRQSALALALLFASEGPASPELNALRREVYGLACQPANSPG